MRSTRSSTSRKGHVDATGEPPRRRTAGRGARPRADRWACTVFVSSARSPSSASSPSVRRAGRRRRAHRPGAHRQRRDVDVLVRPTHPVEHDVVVDESRAPTPPGNTTTSRRQLFVGGRRPRCRGRPLSSTPHDARSMSDDRAPRAGDALQHLVRADAIEGGGAGQGPDLSMVMPSSVRATQRQRSGEAAACAAGKPVMRPSVGARSGGGSRRRRAELADERAAHRLGRSEADACGDRGAPSVGVLELAAGRLQPAGGDVAGRRHAETRR